jgi:outer membrane receptor protein involved in Fe transport
MFRVADRTLLPWIALCVLSLPGNRVAGMNTAQSLPGLLISRPLWLSGAAVDEPGPIQRDGAADTSSATPPVYTLSDSVFVYGTRIPARLGRAVFSGRVLTRGDVEFRTAPTVTSLLSRVVGLHAYDASGGAGETVVDTRGYASFGRTSYLAVLVDSDPMRDVAQDGVDWDELSPGQIDRVEVIRGPAAYLHGNAAGGGLVNIITRRPHTGTSRWLEAEGGSGGRVRATSGIGRAIGRGWGIVSVRAERADGNRAHSDQNRLSGAAQGALELRPGLSLLLRSRLSAAHRSLPGPLPLALADSDPDTVWSFDGSPPVDGRTTRSWHLSTELNGSREKTTSWNLTLRGNGEDADITETIVPVGSMDRKTRARDYGGESSVRRVLGRGPIRTALVGAEIRRGDLFDRYFERQTATRVGMARVRRITTAAFGLLQSAEWRGPLRGPDALELYAGLRWDRLSSALRPAESSAEDQNNTAAATSPFLGVTWSLPHVGTLHASAAESFKVPTLEQLFDRRPYDMDGPGPVPPGYLSNRALDPERGKHAEFGVRVGTARSWRADASVYIARIRDEIGFDLGTFHYANIDRSTHAGLEMQGTGDLSTWLHAAAGYAFTSARFDGGKTDGKQINNVPRHQIQADLSYATPRFTASLGVRHTRGQWLDEENRYALAPFTTFDLSSTVRALRGEILFGVDNLTDKRQAPSGYLTSAPAIGPNGEPEIGEDGQPILVDLPLVFPGTGRSFRAGLRWETP